MGVLPVGSPRTKGFLLLFLNLLILLAMYVAAHLLIASAVGWMMILM
jgi:hypothetical protein